MPMGCALWVWPEHRTLWNLWTVRITATTRVIGTSRDLRVLTLLMMMLTRTGMVHNLRVVRTVRRLITSLWTFDEGLSDLAVSVTVRVCF